MNAITTPIEEWPQLKKIKCRCLLCSAEFFISKSLARRVAKGTKKVKFCSETCAKKNKRTQETVLCKCCGRTFLKRQSEIKKTKHNFCSQKCAGIYSAQNKQHGTRRAKLEKWIEEQLFLLFPDLEIHFNRRDTINSELDIYIPSLKLAFELNGIFHYEPIFGKEKLLNIKNNDERKFQACLESEIELCIINTSNQKVFKEKSSKKYLDIIVDIIKAKAPTQDRTEI